MREGTAIPSEVDPFVSAAGQREHTDIYCTGATALFKQSCIVWIHVMLKIYRHGIY